MVVVQLSPAAKLAVGLIVKLVGPPLTAVSATLRVPLVAQTIWNQLPVTSTGSLKVIVRLVLVAWSVAPLVGVVLLTLGAVSSVLVNEKTKLVAILSGG